MSPHLHPLFVLSIIITFFAITPNPSHCFSPKTFNVSYRNVKNWAPAVVTWYGSPDGAGSDGGACGYQSDVESAPFDKMISAGGPAIYQSAKGCGACYQVKCTDIKACSGKPVTITITDECPGCEPVHFDLSGTAFGAMAKPGQANKLRNAGKFKIQYRRVDCNYHGVPITVRVDPGSNPYYLAMLIKYTNGDGSLRSVEVQPAGQGSWTSMQHSWGALWKLNDGGGLKGSLSIRLTEESNKVVILHHVFPSNWKPGQTYKSQVNFDV